MIGPLSPDREGQCPMPLPSPSSKGKPNDAIVPGELKRAWSSPGCVNTRHGSHTSHHSFVFCLKASSESSDLNVPDFIFGFENTDGLGVVMCLHVVCAAAGQGLAQNRQLTSWTLPVYGHVFPSQWSVTSQHCPS